MGKPKRTRKRPAITCYWYLPLIFVAMLPAIAYAQGAQGDASTVHNDKNWTFNAGLGSSKAWNLVGITRELFIGDHASAFITVGLGEMVIGAGLAYYENRQHDGLVLSAVAGTGLQFALTYRWKLLGADYLVLGGSYVRVFGFSDVDHPRVLPVCAYEHQF